jgi:hypothetical protein
MAPSSRPIGLGIYQVIAPPHPRDDLRTTHRDSARLPAVTAAQVARELDRRLAAPADLRDVADAYLELSLTMPGERS